MKSKIVKFANVIFVLVMKGEYYRQLNVTRCLQETSRFLAFSSLKALFLNFRLFFRIRDVRIEKRN